jgi:D-threo-aldose 1-dehydrogenase
MAPIEQRFIGTTRLAVDVLGFGCAPLGNLYHAIGNDVADELLRTAWAEGFRYFDTAPHYGQGLSERRLGDALRSQRGRGFVLSTKVGRLLRPAGYAGTRHGFVSPMPFDIIYDYGYDGVMRSFEDSRQRLGLDRIDILYMHDIGAVTHGADNEHLFPVAMDGGYRALAELRRNGDVAAIGIGANEWQVCEAALEHGDWDCFLLAGRYTLLEQGALDTFLPKCVARKASVVIGGPYNSGILATGVRRAGAGHYNYDRAPERIVATVNRIEGICADFDVPLAAAALQFPLAHSAVASVIPGLDDVRQVAETKALISTRIPDGFWKALVEANLVRSDAPLPGQVATAR